MNIIVENMASGSYRARVEGRTDIWGTGKGIDDAIGDLIRSNKELFGIESITY